MPKRTGMTFAEVRRIALALPGVEESTSYGTPAFKVKGKFLARLREDNESLAIKCGFDERDLRLQGDPRTFFVTDHYRGYPVVLVHMSVVTPTTLAQVMEEAWRRNAPKRLINEWIASQVTAEAVPRAKARRPPRRSG